MVALKDHQRMHTYRLVRVMIRAYTLAYAQGYTYTTVMTESLPRTRFSLYNEHNHKNKRINYFMLNERKGTRQGNCSIDKRRLNDSHTKCV